MVKNQTMKMHQTLKEEYDIWAMEMEHYFEYIDNEVWKVIQNGNSKKRISIGKYGVVRVLSPVTAAEIQAVEKERKSNFPLLLLGSSSLMVYFENGLLGNGCGPYHGLECVG
ncbi:hypothetical protein Tco_1222547 [Tanacetum coccineum]